MSPRRSTLVSVLCWALASSATALLAHALIAFSASFSVEPAYGEHSHIAVVPVTMIAVTIATALLLSVVLRTISRQHASDPVVLLAKHVGEMRPIVPVVSVGFGGLGTLITMELIEQFRAFGHISGLADAFDGNAPLSIAITLAVAVAVGYAGVRCAHFFINRVVAIVDEIMTRVRPDTIATPCTGMRRRNARACANVPCVYFTRSFGLRAPPLLLV